MNTTIVKRHNHVEPYDPYKLLRSVYASCLAVRTPAGEAEITAKRVEKDLAVWVRKRPEITSHDIRVRAAELLVAYNPDAAITYKNHGIVH